MLIENISPELGEVEKRDRNWMIRIYSSLEQGENVQIECHREILLVKNNKKLDTGGLYGERQYMVSRSLNEILYETVTLPPEAGGITLTAGQVAMALELLSNKFAAVILDNINPSTCEPGSGEFVLTVNGSVFQPDSIVLWNGNSLETTYVNAAQITAVVPAELVMQDTTAKITVISKSGTTNEIFFNVIANDGEING